jgi:YegS/Rv2252/BmrU family lipid kinase
LPYHYACAVSASDLQTTTAPGAPPVSKGTARTSVCLIVNPAAGGGRAGRAATEVVAALRGHGLAVRREDTRDLDHARELALEAARGGELAVTLGGDGLAGAAADALRVVPGSILGVLPGGRGNDLVRVLGIGQDPVAACATIAGGVARELDLGLVGEHTFVGIASCGFDSDANRIANEAPSWLGNLVYAYGALRALVAWRPARFELVLDGQRHAFTGYSVGAANSKAYGGGMYAAPDALLDDGLLDVPYCEQIPKLRFLTRILPKVFKGTHVREPSVHVLRGRELQIAADRPFTLYADGDPIGELPLCVSVLPAAVRVLVPADSPLGSPRNVGGSGPPDAGAGAGTAASPSSDEP